MNNFIKFKRVDMKKRDIFEWLSTTLEEHGWINITSNPNKEGWYYQSKGEDGKQSIIVNFLDGYDAHKSNQFTTTASRHFDIRMVNSYTPSTTPGTNGVSVPGLTAGSFIRTYIGTGNSYLYPDANMTIHYHCTKDRMIFTITTETTTVFIMFGKPTKNYAKDYGNTGSMVFTTNNYKFYNATSWGVADRPNTSHTQMIPLYINTAKGFNEKSKHVTMSEIGYGSELEGIKGLLEGIYYIGSLGNLSGDSIMTGDKIVDELGNEFTIFFTRRTDSSSYPLAMPEGHIAICTRLAGED